VTIPKGKPRKRLAKAKPGTVTLDELVELLGVGLCTIKKWLAAGLPAVRVPYAPTGGRTRWAVDPDAALVWMADHGRKSPYTDALSVAALDTAAESVTATPLSKGKRGRKAARTDEADALTKLAAAGIEEDLLTKQGLDGALERLRWTEAEVGRQLVRLLKTEGASLDDVEGAGKVISAARRAKIESLREMQAKLTRLLRDTELKFLEFERERGVLIDAREVEALWSSIAVWVRDSVLEIPTHVATLLAPYLRDQAKLPDALRIIEEACRDTLTSMDPAKMPEVERRQADE